MSAGHGGGGGGGGAGGIKAGAAYVELLLHDKAFAKGLTNASHKLKSFGKGLSIMGAAVAGAGAAITAPILAAVHGVTEMGTKLQLMHERTGLSVESLSELRYAAEQSGATLEDVQKAMLMGARKGYDPAKFDEYAAALAAIESPAKRAELAFKMFGRGTAAILPMLERLPELRAQARELGLVMSGETAESAHKLHNAFNTMGRVIGGVKGAIGSALIPTVQAGVEWFTKMALSVRDWVRQNKALFVAAFRVGVALTAIGTAIGALGVSFIVAGAALNGFNILIGVVAATIGAILSPIGLIASGLAALAYWFATSTEFGRNMVAGLAGWFGQLWEIAKETFGGIADAIAAGNLALAVKVAWAGIKLFWLQGTREIRESWIEFKDWFLRTTLEVVFKAQEYWIRLSAFVHKMWSGMVNYSRRLGETIGHIMTRSSDPELQKDQDKAFADRIKGIANEGRADAASIEAEKQAALAGLDAAKQTANETRASEKNKEQIALEQSLADAKAELAAMREQAGKERADRELDKGPKFEGGDAPELPDMKKVKGEVFATFSAAAAVAQGGGGTAAESLKEQREIRKLTGRMLQEIQRNGVIN